MDFKMVTQLRPPHKSEWEKRMPSLVKVLRDLPTGAVVGAMAIAHQLDLSVREFRAMRQSGGFPKPDLRGEKNSLWWSARKLADALDSTKEKTGA